LVGLPCEPLRPSHPVNSEGSGLVRSAVPGCAQQWQEKLTKKLMTSVSVFLAKPQVTGFGNRQVE
jgi:hypothetical protein